VRDPADRQARKSTRREAEEPLSTTCGRALACLNPIEDPTKGMAFTKALQPLRRIVASSPENHVSWSGRKYSSKSGWTSATEIAARKVGFQPRRIRQDSPAAQKRALDAFTPEPFYGLPGMSGGVSHLSPE
jgi:hypothetical protein